MVLCVLSQNRLLEKYKKIHRHPRKCEGRLTHTQFCKKQRHSVLTYLTTDLVSLAGKLSKDASGTTRAGGKNALCVRHAVNISLYA